MDGIDQYKHNPLLWAALVLLDHIDTDDADQFSEINLHNVLNKIGAYEFIVESFLEEGFEKPSTSDIVRSALELYKISS